MNNITFRQIERWTLKEKKPEGHGPHPLTLLLHGWTGDENSMWIFSSRLPSHHWLVAPRGLHPSPIGGFSWCADQQETYPSFDCFYPAVEALLKLLTPGNFPDAALDRFFVVGFSQGAALAYTLALLHPHRVWAVAGLSGFFPSGAEQSVAGQPLLGKPVFIAHGTEDALVPFSMARQAVMQLQKAGAKVSYCEHQAGHKLDIRCFASLQSFFRALTD